jgi:hypothetical protein
MRKVIIAVMLFAAVCMANQMQRDMLLFARLASRQTTVPWTPADIEDLYYWFDPADSSTITTSNDFVMTWASKGSNTGEATAITGFPAVYTNDTVSGNMAVFFDGSSNMRGYNLPTAIELPNQNITAHSFFSSYARASDGIVTIGWGHVGGTGAPGMHWIDNKLYVQTQGRFRITTNTYSSGRGMLVYFSDGSINQTDANMRRTGAAVVDLSAAGSAGTATGVDALGFYSTTGNRYHNGFLFDLIYVPRKMTVAEIQKAEGYIAHKWGFAANLPADHPYKENAPTK